MKNRRSAAAGLVRDPDPRERRQHHPEAPSEEAAEAGREPALLPRPHPRMDRREAGGGRVPEERAAAAEDAVREQPPQPETGPLRRVLPRRKWSPPSYLENGTNPVLSFRARKTARRTSEAIRLINKKIKQLI
ncbi:UNVERIFIED_CONTAM: hypothetical protein PYX00_003367 [Menopon gallinae]|uniref:Uncharacterized protein n=1 Tax=Menopon gallinae TaxID=328185 RepID=A0AAW2I017_9NEOP